MTPSIITIFSGQLLALLREQERELVFARQGKKLIIKDEAELGYLGDNLIIVSWVGKIYKFDDVICSLLVIRAFEPG